MPVREALDAQLMEQISIERLARRQLEKLEAGHPHYPFNRRPKPRDSTTAPAPDCNSTVKRGEGGALAVD